MADQAVPGSEATAPAAGAKTGAAAKTDTNKGFDLVVGKATDAFKPWQQIPAWVLGGAAILAGAALIAFPHHLSDAQSRDAWAAVIVALFLAVLLSYRSAFTLNEDDSPAPSGTPKPQGAEAADAPTPGAH